MRARSSAFVRIRSDEARSDTGRFYLELAGEIAVNWLTTSMAPPRAASARLLLLRRIWMVVEHDRVLVQ
jgi:hypothetical protein